ncbi:MAG: hypothetical protein AMXMBFR4_01800 [Candidatus Hydrogenedentota bacterium]
MLTLRHAWQLVVFVFGASVVLVGIAMLVLPGPAFIVIPMGLAILATEFVWARHLLKRIKSNAESVAKAMWTSTPATDQKPDTPATRNPAGTHQSLGVKPPSFAVDVREPRNL